jgi:hypothetical protein
MIRHFYAKREAPSPLSSFSVGAATAAGILSLGLVVLVLALRRPVLALLGYVIDFVFERAVPDSIPPITRQPVIWSNVFSLTVVGVILVTLGLLLGSKLASAGRLSNLTK